jgi:hypothetical protein
LIIFVSRDFLIGASTFSAVRKEWGCIVKWRFANLEIQSIGPIGGMCLHRGQAFTTSANCTS